MSEWNFTPLARRGLLVLGSAGLIGVLPALHPLLRPVVGVPSHLLWFAHTLPVAMLAYTFGFRAAVLATLASVIGVAGGERLFGAGYGIAADEATVLALSTAVGLTDSLVGAFALAVRQEQARRRDQAQVVTAALSTFPEAMLLLDANEIIQYANGAARRLFGTQPGELAGSPFRQLLAPGGEVEPVAASAADRRQAVPVVARTVNGRPFAAELAVSPVRDAAVRPIAYLVTVRDQSDRVRAEQARRRTETLSELGATIASIAHELNNPLASVVAYAELLQEASGLSEQAASDLRTIAHEARRAAGIARQLLNLVRRGEQPRRPVDVNELVERTLRARAASFAAHGIQVRFQPRAGLPLVSAVPGEIEQVLVNLLANAEQAMHEARGRGQLEVFTRPAGEGVEVVVKDDGPGIEPDHLPRLFESFFTTKPVGVGTGLGLAIARRIARDHGGELSAESELGRGATFTLRLPAAASEQAPAAPPAEPMPQAARNRTGGPVRLLVVEDEPALRQSVSRLLQAQGWRVEGVGDAEAALARLGSEPFDLVLCDVHLGGRSGLELYDAAVGRRPELASRFLFVTGDVLSHEVREFLERTGARQLSKPFELAELVGAIRQFDHAAEPAGSAR